MEGCMNPIYQNDNFSSLALDLLLPKKTWTIKAEMTSARMIIDGVWPISMYAEYMYYVF